MSIITFPFSWLLMTFYEFAGNYGVAMLLFALLVKLIMLPFQMKSKRSTMRMTRLNPRIKQLEKRYEGNKQKYQEEVSKIYKEEGINPMSGCLWSIIPFPILILLYRVIQLPLTNLMRLTEDQIIRVQQTLETMGLYTIPEKSGAYEQITLTNLIHDNFEAVKSVVPEVVDIDFNFLGINLGYQPDFLFFAKVDWSSPPAWIPALGLFLIPLLSGALAFVSMKINAKVNPQPVDQPGNLKMMSYMMPLISVYIGFIVPAALCVYWIAGNFLAIFQDLWLNRHYNRILDIEEAERNERIRLRDEELEQKRLETERLKAQGITVQNQNTSKKKRYIQEKIKNEERVAAAIAANREENDERTPDSQVGKRKYARGRSYVADRYINPENATEASLLASQESEGAGSIDTEAEDDTVSEGSRDEINDGETYDNESDSENPYGDENEDLNDDKEIEEETD